MGLGLSMLKENLKLEKKEEIVYILAGDPGHLCKTQNPWLRQSLANTTTARQWKHRMQENTRYKC